MRGGACAVLRTSIKDKITDFTASVISSLITAECQAASQQCNHGKVRMYLNLLFHFIIVPKQMCNQRT